MELKIFIVSLVLLCTAATEAQINTPTPATSASPATTDITKVLEKAGQFTTFIKLLKSTQVSNQINSQLSGPASSQGITVFAPTDNAFAGLKTGTLNSLSPENQLRLVQYHVLPAFYGLTQFQTASNPLHTQAGNSDDGHFPLNVTSDASGNQVNVTTGVVTASISNTVYSDAAGQLAIFAVDKVLLPLDIFGTAAPAMAPAMDPAKSGEGVKESGSDDDGGVPAGGDGDDKDSSAATSGLRLGFEAASLFLFVGFSF